MALYPYQERVKELILSGQSVILQAPTGAGKTRAALAPFIEAFFERPPDAFPRKCIYSVPMRVLANQFYADYHELSDQYRRNHRKDISVGIQTGDRPEDRKLESNIIFSTIDQTLSNFLNIPYALGTGSANLNAGAIVSSYLIFDELHLFDPATTLPTTLAMLRRLKGITPFIIMTATFSSSMLERLATLLDATVVPEDASNRISMQKIGSQVDKVRRFHTLDKPLTAIQVLDKKHSVPRTICICNTVRSAQDLYQQIKNTLQQNGDTETQLCLLHSRFYKSDRDAKEAWIREQFGAAQAEYDGPPLILVATQVIEVGVDATCDVMHTEIAPASSILQRAGRCARRQSETGDVYVYLPRTDEGEPDFTPYFLATRAQQSERGRQLCEATWATLSSATFKGKHFDFSKEQQLIDLVHTPVDTAILDDISDNHSMHQEDMLKTMQSLNSGMASELIRNVNARFVVIHPEPEQDENLQRNPWHYDGFTLFPGQIARAFDELESVLSPEVSWMMKWAHRIEGNSQDGHDLPSRQKPEYRWTDMREGKEIYSNAVVAVHPAIAHYSQELGFEFALSDDTYTARHRPKKQRPSSYSYQKETYAEHAYGLYRAYKYALPNPETGKMRLALADEIAFTVTQMSKHGKFGLEDGKIEQLLSLIFACHDLGKLNVNWQQWAHKWQKEVGRFYGDIDMSLPKAYMVAHTDHDPTKEQKDAQKKLGKRPPHAGESAMAAGQLLYDFCDGNEALWRATMTAIARHHHAATDSYKPFRMNQFAKQSFQESLEIIGLPEGTIEELASQVQYEVGNEGDLSRYLIYYERRGWHSLFLYFLLIRVLRLADQRSQEK